MDSFRYIIPLSLFTALLYGAPDDVVRTPSRPKGVGRSCPFLLSKLKTSPYHGFYPGIARHRADDTLRWVFSDRIEEDGKGDRAEFTRKQIELSRLLDHYGTHVIDDLPTKYIFIARALEASIADDLEKHGAGWAPRLSGVVGVEFHRGVVEGLVIDLEKWSREIGTEEKRAQFLARNREVDRLTLVGVTPDTLREFLLIPGIEGISHLAIEGGTVGDLAVFTNNSRLRGLRRLDLDGIELGAAGIEAIARSSHLESLTNHLGALTNLGRLYRYSRQWWNANRLPTESFVTQAGAWVESRATPPRLRREAYLELLEQGQMGFGDISTHFTTAAENAAVWEQVLNQGRFQRRIGEMSFREAVGFYFQVPKKLREKPRSLSVSEGSRGES